MISFGKIGCRRIMLHNFSAKDYIQDGLVAMWDGIENAGWGVHNPNATVWKDLTNSSYDALQRVETEGWKWGDNCYVGLLQNGHGFHVPSAFSALLYNLIASHTVEICFAPTANVRMTIFGQYGDGTNFEYYPISVYRTYYNGNPDFSAKSSNWYENRLQITCVSTCDGLASRIFLNGVLKNSSRQPGLGSIKSSNDFIIGGENSRPSMSILGELYAIRVYSRALATNEIATNYAIDKVRFNLQETT